MVDSPDEPTGDPGYDLVPVDRDPFENAHGQGPQGNVAAPLAGAMEGAAQRAWNWYQNQPSWADKAAALDKQSQDIRAAGGSWGDVMRAAAPQAMDVLGGFAGSTTPKVTLAGAANVADSAALAANEYKVFHGSNQPISSIADLKPSQSGEFGPGTYFSDNPNTAYMFGSRNGEEGVHLIPSIVTMEKPFTVAKQDWLQMTQNKTPRQVQAKLKDQGYDGIIGVGLNGVDKQFIPFDNSQVRSAIAAPESGPAPPMDLPKGITAYHGSPHDFDKFDLSKIGTGEGAQAYGHGLYFAENPETARAYREKLAGAPTTQFAGSDYAFSEAQKAVNQHRLDNPINQYLDSVRGDVMKSVANHVVEDHGQDLSTPGYINEVVKSYPPDVQDQIREWANQAHAIVKPQLGVNSPGKMYQVNINADPEHFLDWDKPLSEQSRIDPELISAVHDFNRAREGRSYNPSSANGQDLYRLLEFQNGREGATQQLRQAGIPGIKYLDQGSRGAGSGTSNYVVFDDNLIDIAKKYGLAGLIAGGAAHYSTTPVDHDPYASGMAMGGAVTRKQRVAGILARKGVAA